MRFLRFAYGMGFVGNPRIPLGYVSGFKIIVENVFVGRGLGLRLPSTPIRRRRHFSHSAIRNPQSAIDSLLLLLISLLLPLPAHSQSSPPPLPALSAPAHLPPAAKAAAEAGIAAMGKNKFEDAEAAFQKLLKLSPDNISGLIDLGMVEYRLGRAEDARNYLERATLRLKPDAALAWMMLGVVYINQHESKWAPPPRWRRPSISTRTARRRTITLRSSSRERGWYSGAEQELQKVIELSPNFAEAHYNLAVLYLQQTPPSVELARRHYQKALDLGAAPDPEVAAKLAAAPVPKTVP